MNGQKKFHPNIEDNDESPVMILDDDDNDLRKCTSRESWGL